MLWVLLFPLLFYILFSFAPEHSYFFTCSLYSCLDLTSLTPIHVYNFSFTTLQAWFGRVPWWVLRSFVLIKGLCESIASLPRRLGPFNLLSRWRTFTDSTRVFYRDFFSSFSLHWQLCLLYLLLGELCPFPFPIPFIAEPLCCAGWCVLPSASWSFPLV